MFRLVYAPQLGTYHYVSGVDASSSASLAAYLNSLTYAVEDNAAWFSKSTAFKVRNGCYWCVVFRLGSKAHEGEGHSLSVVVLTHFLVSMFA